MRSTSLLRGEHNDGRKVMLPDGPTNGQPIQARQHPIQNNQVQGILLDKGERCLSVEGLVNGAALRTLLSFFFRKSIWLLVTSLASQSSTFLFLTLLFTVS